MKKEKNEIKEVVIRNSTVEFLIFQNNIGGDGVEVRVQDGTIWLSQKLMGKLFNTTPENILIHLKNIFDSGEQDENSVTKKYLATATDGKNYNTLHYNLEAIISVGYRVNSQRATMFRRWATAVLRDFTLHGYVLDKKRLENGTFFDEDYFERLLDDIREIRLSERRFYQKVTDIYALSFDYDKDSKTTKDFFKKVQNKLLFASTSHTAPEIIYSRADGKKENMGLTSWANSPQGKILKSDVIISKNYLTQDELENLSLIVSAYLDLAQRRAKAKIPMSMDDWAIHLDKILVADGNKLLTGTGTILREIANEHAENEYEKYRVIQDRLYKNDFDILIEKVNKGKKKK